MAASDDLIKALSVIGQIPQTQSDISKLAQTAEMAKSPEFQAGLKAAETQVTNFAYAHLALSAVSVLVGFATFLVLLRRCQTEERMALNGRKRR
jgi:hypothetical protein